MKYTLLHYLDYCKCTQPFTLNVDSLRVRIPATDALEIIKNMLVINDMSGLLDIEILRERYYVNKVWKRSREYEVVDSGKLSGEGRDTAKTFYIG